MARRLSLALLALAPLAGGCLHTSDMRACTPAPGESECWERSLLDERGGVRAHEIERTIPDARCDLLVVDRIELDEAGMVTARVVEESRCRVVQRRTTERYDLLTGSLEIEVAVDEDHDDRIDLVSTETRRLTQEQRMFVLSPPTFSDGRRG